MGNSGPHRPIGLTTAFDQGPKLIEASSRSQSVRESTGIAVTPGFMIHSTMEEIQRDC
jgi:hypothetical protein